MGQTDLGFQSGIRIGTTLGNMETVKVEPHIEYRPGKTEDVVCGEKKETGYPVCIWTYPDMELSAEQYYQLWKQTNGALSGSVYIRIPTREVELVVSTYQVKYATYSAVMRWPDEGLVQGLYSRWVIPEIEFKTLVAT